MVHRPGLRLLVVFLVAGSVFGQTAVNGVLRRISDDELVVKTGDKVVVTLKLGITTKYYKASGAMIKAADLQPGDHLSVDATQDDNGVLHAKNVNQVKAGTPQERAAASQPAERSPIANGTPDPNDSGPPVLKRGVPSSRPSIHADEVNGVTRTPDAPKVDSSAGTADRVIFPQTGDPVIDKARAAAFSFSKTLPNFVVKQITTRFETLAAHGGQTSWRTIDTVTADVVSEDGKESYKNVLIGGKPATEALENRGTWSTGEYSSVLLDVLSPSTRARFQHQRSTTIANRAAYLYDYSVEQPNSHWDVESRTGSYRPEYTGAVWIDKENSRVLRVELSARHMPAAFPLDTVECAIDYDFVPIGDGKFLLPVHSEILSCERGTNSCSRNAIDFRDYKKFSADTSITFDDSPGK